VKPVDWPQTAQEFAKVRALITCADGEPPSSSRTPDSG
jgi:hypothetical protein